MRLYFLATTLKDESLGCVYWSTVILSKSHWPNPEGVCILANGIFLEVAWHIFLITTFGIRHLSLKLILALHTLMQRNGRKNALNVGRSIMRPCGNRIQSKLSNNCIIITFDIILTSQAAPNCILIEAEGWAPRTVWGCLAGHYCAAEPEVGFLFSQS